MESNPSGQAAAVLEVNDLTVELVQQGRLVRVVDRVTYSLRAGQTLAVIGESGSGKTVSSRALMGLLPRTAQLSGSVKLGGEEILTMSNDELRERRGRDIGMVFQDPARSLNPTMRCGLQIAEAIRVHERISKEAARARAVELLRLVRIPSPEQRFAAFPHQLSGGMRQRVMIAIALACRPRVLIADEATTALDVTTQAQIMDLLVSLQQELGMAIVMISHDMGLAASYSDEVLVMYAGRIVESAHTMDLFENVRMPYTRALMNAIPNLDAEPHGKLPVAPGRPPSLDSLVAGCAFSPRCVYADDQCRQERPSLLEHEPGHFWACFHPLEEGGAPC